MTNTTVQCVTSDWQKWEAIPCYSGKCGGKSPPCSTTTAMAPTLQLCLQMHRLVYLSPSRGMVQHKLHIKFAWWIVAWESCEITERIWTKLGELASHKLPAWNKMVPIIALYYCMKKISWKINHRVFEVKCISTSQHAVIAQTFYQSLNLNCVELHSFCQPMQAMHNKSM